MRKAPGARELINRACDTGSAEGCDQVAVSIAKREPARAQALFARACTGADRGRVYPRSAAHRSAGAIDPAITTRLGAYWR